ncbi:hypothetical protein D3C87_1955500 [compost metagenome]
MVDREVEGVFLDEEIFVQGVTAFEAVVQRADVATGTKSLFTGTAQNHRVHLRVLSPGIELAVQVAHHVQGNGVEAGGAVEGQMPDVVAYLGQHFILRGLHGLRALR